jgi:hypothetical protein
MGITAVYLHRGNTGEWIMHSGVSPELLGQGPERKNREWKRRSENLKKRMKRVGCSFPG